MPAKAAVWYVFCNVLQKGVSFIVIPFYIRFLSTAEYGKYAVFNSWVNILIVFATLNLYCGIFTKAMVDFKDERERYTSSMQGLSSTLTSIILIFYFFWPGMWQDVFSMDSNTTLLLFAYFLFFPAFSFWSVRQRVDFKYKRMVLITLFVTFLTPTVSLFLLKYTDLRELAVIWGFLLVHIFVGCFFYLLHFARGKCFYDAKYWKHAIKFNTPLIPHYLSLMVLGQSDRIMIQRYCGESEVGIYTLAYQFSMAMGLFTGAINQSLVPWLYEKLKSKEFQKISDPCSNLCLMVGILTILVMIIAPEFLLVFGTEEYWSAIWIIPSVAMSCYYSFCYGLFSTVEFYYSATKYVMVSSIAGASLNILLNALFLPRFGFLAAGYTTMLSYFVLMVMHYIFMTKICRNNELNEELFDIKRMATTVVFLLLVMFFCLWLYSFFIVRYLIVLIVLFLAFIFKNRIKILVFNLDRN